jgi:hypothetical protein
MTVAEVAHLVSKCFLQPIPVKIFKKNLSLPPARYVPCTRRARDELGLTQQIESCGAILKTIHWSQNENAA